MLLTTGSRLGPYEILGALGVGGMGEVYRARDTRLKRDVAIKILPESFASEPERLARFQREAEVLASLNHPNIAAIYGLEESDGVRALVMELVEGETLADRIARGPIPLDEALPIAKQIAEALEAAHEQGIIHRDLKPANIKVRDDGTVKVLDFGLAKLVETTGSANPDALSMSPTITSPALISGVGVLLGTAAYMAPEQVRGKAVDKRVDIWAFGCVLYEMLTAARAFAGEDVATTLARVMEREPDFALAPATVAPKVIQAMRVCLQKNPKARAADIRDVRLALDGAFETTARLSSRERTGKMSLLVGMAAAASIAAAITALAVTWVMQRPPAASVSTFSLVPSGDAALTPTGADRNIAIAPDGSRIVYVGNRGTQLFVRALDALQPKAIFTGSPRNVFFSPDGRWIGFVDDNTTLKKISADGGPAVTVATMDGTPRGATWGPNDTIVFATTDAVTGLQRVSAEGGSPSVLTRTKAPIDHRWPEWISGTHTVLYTITARDIEASQIAALDVDTGQTTVLIRGGTDAHYVASPEGRKAAGYLIYAAGGSLWGVGFDVATRKVTGGAVPVVSKIATSGTGGLQAVVASNGTLAYVVGGDLASAQRTLMLVDRDGRETAIPAPPHAYNSPRISPDGTRIAVSANDQDYDIWVWNRLRATLTRLTFDARQDYAPIWTPDSRRIAFSSDRSGMQTLYEQAADGTGVAARLVDNDNPFPQETTGITADGSRLIFDELTPAAQHDLRIITLGPHVRIDSLLETKFDERNGTVSSDDRFLAYESNSSGRAEIYVRPFPNVNSGQWQVSSTGGTQPTWARNGRELFYVGPDAALYSVSVEPRGTEWNAGIPRKVLNAMYYAGSVGAGGQTRQYDVSPDGKQFVMIKEDGFGGAAAGLIVVEHWTEQLSRLVRSK